MDIATTGITAAVPFVAAAYMAALGYTEARRKETPESFDTNRILRTFGLALVIAVVQGLAGVTMDPGIIIPAGALDFLALFTLNKGANIISPPKPTPPLEPTTGIPIVTGDNAGQVVPGTGTGTAGQVPPGNPGVTGPFPPGNFDPREHSANDSGVDARGVLVRGLKMSDLSKDHNTKGLDEVDRAAFLRQVEEAEAAGIRMYKILLSKGYYVVENGIVYGEPDSVTS